MGALQYGEEMRRMVSKDSYSNQELDGDVTEDPVEQKVRSALDDNSEFDEECEEESDGETSFDEDYDIQPRRRRSEVEIRTQMTNRGHSRHARYKSYRSNKSSKSSKSSKSKRSSKNRKKVTFIFTVLICSKPR